LRIRSCIWTATSVGANDTLQVAVKVRNSGQRAGDEVVQLYLRPVAPQRERAIHELRGIQRIVLQAGEEREVSFAITPAKDPAYLRRRIAHVRGRSGCIRGRRSVRRVRIYGYRVASPSSRERNVARHPGESRDSSFWHIARHSGESRNPAPWFLSFNEKSKELDPGFRRMTSKRTRCEDKGLRGSCGHYCPAFSAGSDTLN
jgi:hypothetical protein